MYLKSIDKNSEQYTTFSTKYGSLFNQPQWLANYGKELEVVGIYNANHELIGTFNITIQKSKGLSLLRLPSYTPYNALCYINPASNNANRITFEKEIHTAIADYLLSKKAGIILQAFPPVINDMQIYTWKGFKVIPNYTYQLALQTETDFLEQFTSEKRKSIRKAEKDGLRIEKVSDYKLVKALVEKTFDRKNKDLSLTMIDKILFQFANASNSFAFIAYQHGKPSACTFCIYDRNTVYYLLGGYDDTNKHHGAGATCMHKSIQHAQTLGLTTFDFEGSMLPEVEKYFREFGGQLVPYYTINKAHFLLEVLLKIKKRAIF
jgi:CelD/BcsL family acetyltransferase involved in cellulose biosynthesis